MTELSAGEEYSARLSACPACDAAHLAQRLAEAREKAARGDLVLSLPTAHCAACITDVERALNAVEGVRRARVNLTLRRVMVDAPDLEAADLIPVLAKIGFEAHELDPSALSSTAAQREGRDILMRIGISGFAMMNIMILSVAVWSGADGATRDMFHWISAAIALPTVAFAGMPFYRNALSSLKGGRLGMDVPISLALILATAISLYEVTLSGHHAYFEAAVMLCFFLLIGRYLDFRSRAVARSAAEELTALEVPRAILLSDGAETVVPVAELRPGDLIRVRPGARLPADGEIVAGQSEIDRSLLTGESLPVPAAPGQALMAGEVNLTGPLDLRVTAAGRDSSLSRLTDLVAAAESARGRYASLADRAARAYSPMVHLLAACALIGWYLATQDLRLALNIAAAVLIITCPCALGLAVPAVVTVASGRLFRQGLLIKEGTALERLAEATHVVFDKTGTLTEGTPELSSPDAIPLALRPVALALAQGSNHPLSRALAEAMVAQGVEAAALDDLREVPGCGIQGSWQGRTVHLGRPDWIGEGLSLPEHDGPISLLRLEGEAPVVLTFTDRLREGAAEAVAALHKAGMSVTLLSGDLAPSVRAMAARLGIEDARAEVTPQDKAQMVQDLAQSGARVLMVGDGLNDTAALAGAHVSMSPASALDAARVASDMVLMGSSLAPIPDALRVARQARARIKENFAISIIYNAVAVPFALAGFATPLMAAIAMSASSISVTLNAMRLRK